MPVLTPIFHQQYKQHYCIVKIRYVVWQRKASRQWNRLCVCLDKEDEDRGPGGGKWG